MANNLPSGKHLDDVQKELETFLKANGVQLGYKMSFPVYRILPDEVKLALAVIAKHEMKISIALEEAKTEQK